MNWLGHVLFCIIFPKWIRVKQINTTVSSILHGCFSESFLYDDVAKIMVNTKPHCCGVLQCITVSY